MIKRGEDRRRWCLY